MPIARSPAKGPHANVKGARLLFLQFTPGGSLISFILGDFRGVFPCVGSRVSFKLSQFAVVLAAGFLVFLDAFLLALAPFHVSLLDFPQRALALFDEFGAGFFGRIGGTTTKEQGEQQDGGACAHTLPPQIAFRR